MRNRILGIGEVIAFIGVIMLAKGLFMYSPTIAYTVLGTITIITGILISRT